MAGRGFEFHKAGLNSVGNYQMSGVPWLSGAIQVPAYNGGDGNGIKLEFPTVTRNITIRNDGASVIWFGFSATAISASVGVGGHRVSLISSGSFTDDFRVTDVWLISDTTAEGKATVVANLTGIRRSEIVNNWSGSSEVHAGLI
jgi:hypothetical protein